MPNRRCSPNWHKNPQDPGAESSTHRLHIMAMTSLNAARRSAARFCTKAVPPAVTSSPAGDSYDLRAAGAASTQPFEDGSGAPTDITASLTTPSRVGYSKRYADGWSRIFEESKQTTGKDASKDPEQ